MDKNDNFNEHYYNIHQENITDHWVCVSNRVIYVVRKGGKPNMNVWLGLHTHWKSQWEASPDLPYSGIPFGNINYAFFSLRSLAI